MSGRLLLSVLLLGCTAHVAAPPGRAQEPLSAGASVQPEPVAGLDAYVERAMASWQAPGLSLVLVRNDSVFTRAYGVTEAGGSVPVTPETLFGIGSLTKAFTATVIATLVDEGRVAWDDPVVRHLPGFEMHDPYVTRHLTIRDVLSHRTGLVGDDLMWVAGGQSPDELVRRLRHQRPAFGFRARFGYHNLMYLVAGELAEEVTGTTWGELVRGRIFEPLGMTRSTTTIGELRARSDVALPHDEIGPGQLLGTASSAIVPLNAPTVIRRVEWFDPGTAPGGGIASTATDFGSWLRFQLGSGVVDGRRLLGEEALLATRTPQILIPGLPANQTEPSVTNLGAYGMGWGIRDYRGRLMVTHVGSTPGFSASTALLPADQVAVAVFINFSQGTGLAGSIQRWVLDRLIGAEPRDWAAEALESDRRRLQAGSAALESAAAARVAGTEPSLPLPAYAGTYVDSLYPPVHVTTSNGALRLVMGPLMAGDLDHWQDDTFRVTWDRADFGANLVRFEIGDGLHPVRLETRILGQDGVWNRSDVSVPERSGGNETGDADLEAAFVGATGPGAEQE